MPHIPFPTVFDSSILATAKACPQKFFKEYLNHWKPKSHSVHLQAGSAFAKGIEVARKAFFEGQYEKLQNTQIGELTFKKEWITTQAEAFNAQASIECGLQALLASYGEFEAPYDSAKTADRMAGALEFYFSNYPLEPDLNAPIVLASGRRAIEFSFAHPLPIAHPETGNPILYCGRMDAILEYAGQPFITDEKTTSQLGATWSRQWDLRSQFTGYAWGCRESGIPAAGAIIRGVSILKTKYETQQAITYRPSWQIDRWYEQTVDLINEILIRWYTYTDGNRAPHQSFPYNLDHTCAEYGGCQFRQACSTEDETPWLETYFEKREWNPLTRQERKL